MSTRKIGYFFGGVYIGAWTIQAALTVGKTLEESVFGWDGAFAVFCTVFIPFCLGVLAGKPEGLQ